MTIKENLYNQRIISIDAFRGITIFVMVFVNELAGISNVPDWMKHMPADADAMTFVDLVFPAFLFIVGMSIPFAFNARLLKNDSPQKIWKHTIKRSLALIVMGLFMVNIEYGYDESSMLISAGFWGFLAYSMPILIWNKYDKNFPVLWKNILQYGGMAVFIALYFLYVQENGNHGMTVKWWGILGLIGWAYLFTVVYYWLVDGRLYMMVLLLTLSIALNCLHSANIIALSNHSWFQFIINHLTHASIVSAGVIISILFFNKKKLALLNWKVIGMAVTFFLVGFLLRPYFEVSKIRATPSWCLYSAGICTIMYYFLYWLMELRKSIKWSYFFMPAAANPLLIYILPGIIIYFNQAFNLHFVPNYFGTGTPGILWSLGFSSIMLLAMKGFNYFKIQLHL